MELENLEEEGQHRQSCCQVRSLAGRANVGELYTGCFFFTGPPPKKLKYEKPRLGKVRCI